MKKTPIKIIDPHIHLFDLEKGQYDWLKPQNPPFWADKEKINRDFNEVDLFVTAPLQLAGFVHIEAGFDNQQPWREIDWLEQHCTLPFRSVAFSDLCSDGFSVVLEQLKQRTSVVGIRYILDDDAYKVLGSGTGEKHLALLQQQNLSFDAQLSLTDELGIKQLIRVANRLPMLKIIINHGGWPLNEISYAAKQSWKTNLIELSHCDNVALKLSGWEMSDRYWKPEQATEVVNSCLDIFGEHRVMLASNFPLCTFSYSFNKLWDKYITLLNVSDTCLSHIIYKNALHWYQFA